MAGQPAGLWTVVWASAQCRIRAGPCSAFPDRPGFCHSHSSKTIIGVPARGGDGPYQLGAIFDRARLIWSLRR